MSQTDNAHTNVGLAHTSTLCSKFSILVGSPPNSNSLLNYLHVLTVLQGQVDLIGNLYHPPKPPAVGLEAALWGRWVSVAMETKWLNPLRVGSAYFPTHSPKASGKILATHRGPCKTNILLGDCKKNGCSAVLSKWLQDDIIA